MAPQKVPIVNAAIIYMCPYTDKPYIIIVRISLSVIVMRHNLLPPFIIIEAGFQINSYHKIQSKDPKYNYHYTYFCGDDFRIPLSLGGFPSYFTMSNTSNHILEIIILSFLVDTR